jgi:uncharacterized metal-binding protein
LATGTLAGLGQGPEVWAGFSVGFLFSTLLFSPDTDIMPKKRAGFLRFFLYPYSLIFKHRGPSHAFVLGTLSRILYGLIVFLLVIFVLNRTGDVSISPHNVLSGLWHFIVAYEYSSFPHRLITWIFLGMAGADACHLLVDKVSSFFKKLWRLL